MSLIDGIGDEVTQFLIAIVLVVIVVVAWWSTNTVRDPRLTRSVYLLDYRIRMIRDQRAYQSNRPTSLQYSRQNNRQIYLENNRSTSTDNIELEDPIETNTSTSLPDAIGETASNPEIISTETESNLAEIEAEQERTSIIQVMDADETEVRRRRIAFFAGRRSDGSSQEIASNKATASSSILSEQSTTAQTEQRGSDDSDEEQEHEDDEESSLDESNVFEGAYDRELDSSIMEHNYAELPIIDNRTITIKLKYTNDDMKIVTGKLQERLGDFKLRHFNDEYSSDRSVRLIFNGKILNDDDKTISSCGIFHNCVVHCLVMQGRREERPRSDVIGESADGSRNAVFAEAARHVQFVRIQQQNAADRNGQQRQQREWNLGTLFSRCTNLLLICAWYLRYSVPHIWTMTATLCLVVLTGFSLVAHVSIFMPSGQAGEQVNIQATRIDRDLNR